VSTMLLILDSGFGEADIERAAVSEFDISVVDAVDQSAGALAELAPSVDGLVVRYRSIDGALMDEHPRLRVIGRYGIGVDNVDLEAASARGIAVVNVPDCCIEEVATHAAALVLAGWRKLPQARELIDAEAWDRWSDLRPIRRLSEATLGLVGLGRIGREVARMLQPFFAQIVAYDPVAQPVSGIRSVELDELFAEADVVSLHCPLTEETLKLANAERLGSMKDGALLVNVSRGGLVDTDALVAGLHAGRPAVAALDVLPVEPPDPSDPLLRAANLLLTNHVAWYSETALHDLRRLIAYRCAAYLAGLPVPSVVNASELAASASPR
jgi:D-3-phosphoglycerate dehydrogenase / 2-oxoglutarate reductase